MSKSLTRDRLIELFWYDPETGIFTNRVSRGAASAGQRAGADTGHGYRRIIIDSIKHYEHHLAWLFIYGEYPDRLDHVDGNRAKNSIANLRKASHAQNCQNAVRQTGNSGIRGAYYDKRVGKWYSKIQVGDRTVWLGTFGSAAEAGLAYQTASSCFHQDFAVHNRPSQGV